MINVIDKTCIEKGCRIRPNYNYEGQLKALYCNEHKKPTMINVKDKTCIEQGCRKRSVYNLPGLIPEFCLIHRKEGMISKPRRKCDECKDNAIYGIKEPIHCEEHCLEDEYNLTENVCKQCKKIDVLNKNGICVNFCSLEERDRIMKKRVKKHEEYINKLLDEEIDIEPFSKDESPDRSCTLKRPDRVYHMGSHIVIIEIDEDQHKSYKCQAYGDTKEGKMKGEKIRMYEISQSYPEFPPCIWIRYNPDTFRVNGKLDKMVDKKRHTILVKWVRESLRDYQTKGIKVKYLFYDEYQETDGKFEEIHKEDVI